MRPDRRTLLAASTAALLLAVSPAGADDRLEVVASFSILGDMVANVGGERVDVVSLVGPDQDAHTFNPAPADAARIAGADLIVVNGLGFEGWIDRLVAASGYDGAVVVATTGVDPLSAGAGHEEHDDHADDHGHAHDDDHHDAVEGQDEAEAHDHDHGDDHADEVADAGDDHHHGAWDPHAWQDLANARIYVTNIAEGLAAVDPGGRAIYEANAETYLAEIDALDAQIRATMAALPESARTVVTSHDAFGYFGHAYGIVFLAPEGISTHDEPSASEIAALIEQIEHDRIAAVFMENISDNRVLERIAEDTGAAIGGALYSDALSGPEGPAPTYLAMMRHNAGQVATALQAF